MIRATVLLILSRKRNERNLVGDNIVITVAHIGRDTVKIGSRTTTDGTAIVQGTAGINGRSRKEETVMGDTSSFGWLETDHYSREAHLNRLKLPRSVRRHRRRSTLSGLLLRPSHGCRRRWIRRRDAARVHPHCPRVPAGMVAG